MGDAYWHLTIRRYSGTGAPETIGQRVRDGLLPELRAEPGFRAYHAARLDGGGGVFSVSVFDSAEAMEAANRRVMAWAAAALSDLLSAPPEVTTADVRVYLGGERPGGDGYVLIRATDGLAGTAEIMPTIQEQLVPLTLAQPGFRRLCTGRDAGRADRAIAVSVFTNRDTATAAHEQVVAMMARHREVWPNPSRVLMGGEVLVSAIAPDLPRVLPAL
jgi:quinol monooxygenase YgiN